MSDIRQIADTRYTPSTAPRGQFSISNILQGAVFVLAFGFATAIVLDLVH